MTRHNLSTIVGKTIEEVSELRSGKYVVSFTDGTVLECSFPRILASNPIKSRFGRAPQRTGRDVRHEADVMRSAAEVESLGRKKHPHVIGDEDVPDFMPDEPFVGTGLTDGAREADLAALRREIPDVSR